MRTFKSLYETAVIHKGSVSEVESLLPKAKTARQLKSKKDARYLSDMSRRIFRAGLKHSLVDARWPAFEKAFNQFDVHYCAFLSDEDIERYVSDASIIRHLGKIKSIRTNAQFIMEVQRRYEGFGGFLSQWPKDEVVQLWLYLRKHGTQLGGHSASRFLRMVGKDTFLLTDDVVAVMKAEGVVSKMPTSQKDLYAVQEVFNQWQIESGRSLCEISRIASMNSF